MSGRPTDGLPWWGKALYFMVLAPIAVVDTISNTVKKLKPKKK